MLRCCFVGALNATYTKGRCKLTSTGLARLHGLLFFLLIELFYIACLSCHCVSLHSSTDYTSLVLQVTHVDELHLLLA